VRADPDPARDFHARTFRRRPPGGASPQQRSTGPPGLPHGGRDLRRSRGGLARGDSPRRACVGAPDAALSLRAPPRSLAKAPSQPVRRRDRPRNLELRLGGHLARPEGGPHALSAVRARHARSLFCSRRSPEVAREAAGLVGPGGARSAGCRGRALHQRGGAPAGRRGLRGPLSPAGCGLWHGGPERRRRRPDRGPPPAPARARDPALPPLPRPHPSQEGLRPSPQSLRGRGGVPSGARPRHRGPRRGGLETGARSPGGGARHRVPRPLAGPSRRRREMGGVQGLRGLRAALAPGEFRHRGRGGPGVRRAGPRHGQGEHLARGRGSRRRARRARRSARRHGPPGALPRARPGRTGPHAPVGQGGLSRPLQHRGCGIGPDARVQEART
jgi:hypothetical protein